MISSEAKGVDRVRSTNLHTFNIAGNDGGTSTSILTIWQQEDTGDLIRFSSFLELLKSQIHAIGYISSSIWFYLFNLMFDFLDIIWFQIHEWRHHLSRVVKLN